MSSAEDVESDAAAGHDERLTRAFDRAARLGIDLESDDGLSERESAAVRAFTALNLDLGADIDTSVAGPAAAGEVGAGVGADGDPGEGASDDGDALPDPQPPADRALRPDAVLRGRPLTRDDTSVTAPLVEEVDVPPSRTVVDPPSRTIDHYLLDLLALAVSTGAFVTPWAWLFVVTVAALLGAAIRSLADHGPHPAALPGRAVRRAVSWLRPRSVAWFTIIVGRTALLAVVIPGVVCAVWWVADQGTNGAFVAGRIGVWAHGPRVAAASVCFMLVAGVGEAHQRRAGQVGRVAAQAGGALVATVAVATVLVATGVVALAPRVDAGRLAGADGLGWAPERVRDNIDRVRDDLVSAELHAAGGCLSDRQGVTWRVDYTGANPVGDPDVARLSAQDASPSPGELATAAAALHNQLAPWVEAIELGDADSTLVRLDRSSLPSGRPLVDPGALVGGSTSGSRLLADGVDAFDREVALACSAAPIP